MNKHFKLLLAVLVTTLIPLWGLAQQPVQTKLTEINIHNVQTIEERVFLIHSIQESEFFSYRLSHEEGKIDIYVSDEYTCQESNANDDFDDFLHLLADLLHLPLGVGVEEDFAQQPRRSWPCRRKHRYIRRD